MIKNSKLPIYYHLPKIHKDITNPPGRPIIASINSLTSHVSKYIDIFLQNYVVELHSYFKDAASQISLFKNFRWQPNFKWAALDVTSLYFKLPQSRGISAVSSFLNEDDMMPSPQKNLILAGIEFILTLNVFQFESIEKEFSVMLNRSLGRSSSVTGKVQSQCY